MLKRRICFGAVFGTALNIYCSQYNLVSQGQQGKKARPARISSNKQTRTTGSQNHTRLAYTMKTTPSRATSFRRQIRPSSTFRPPPIVLADNPAFLSQLRCPSWRAFSVSLDAALKRYSLWCACSSRQSVIVPAAADEIVAVSSSLLAASAGAPTAALASRLGETGVPSSPNA